MGPGPKPGAGSAHFAEEGHSGAGWLPSHVWQTCRYLQLRNFAPFLIEELLTSLMEFEKGFGLATTIGPTSVRRQLATCALQPTTQK